MGTSAVKVVHLITLLEFGGAQGNTIHTVQHLDPDDFETHLWTGHGAYWDKKVKGPLGLSEKVRYFPFLVRDPNPFFDLMALFQLWRALRKSKTDILHTHSSKAGIIGRLAGWVAGVPHIIHTFHGFGFNDEQKPWVRWFYVSLEKLMAPLCDRLIFVSQSNQTLATKLGIGLPEQYELIRSGVPMGQIKKNGMSVNRGQFRNQQGIPTNAKVVITIGAFKPQKNLFDFLETAKKISDVVPESFFVLLGDGILRNSLENRVKELDLSSRILMPGWREDATSFLAVSDVFVMTSLWEGLPRALVEAMLLGLPSVCYDTDGARDLLNREEGTLVPQRDVEALAQKVSFLLNQDRQPNQLSEELKKRITNDFDIDFMVQQQALLYKKLLLRRSQVDNPQLKH